MKALRRLWHALRDRHVTIAIETRCGVAHAVCRCGWAQPVDRKAPSTAGQKYDFTKAVRARRLTDALRAEQQRLARRRGDVGSTSVTVHRFESDRRSAR